MATIERTHWLVSDPKGLDIFTDHNNLIFRFDRLSIQTDLTEPASFKVLRWAVRLSASIYVCVHIKGEEKIWADLISRWTSPPTPIIRRLVPLPALLSISNSKLTWPTAHSIKIEQSLHRISLKLIKHDGLWHTDKDQVLIPDNSDQLWSRLLIIAHMGASGNLGFDS